VRVDIIEVRLWKKLECGATKFVDSLALIESDDFGNAKINSMNTVDQPRIE